MGYLLLRTLSFRFIFAGFVVGCLMCLLFIGLSPTFYLKKVRSVPGYTNAIGRKSATEVENNGTSLLTARPNGTSLVTARAKTIASLDEDWGKVECPLSELTTNNDNLHTYITDVTLPCIFKMAVGGSFKGPDFHGEKWMCMDKWFNIKQNDCIVLSFGILNDWTFDDEIDHLFGCQVYAFDPTIMQNDHRRSGNIQFFNLGISDGPGFKGNGKVDSYSGILKKLGLENAIIDYLKIDVENDEYKFFKDVLANTPNLLKNVKQIGMEVHLPEHEEEAWRYLQQLDCLGFKVMFFNFNPVLPVTVVNGRNRGTLYEIVWGLQRDW